MAFFEEEYLAGSPNWEIGRPQEAFIHLLKIGGIRGDVLDVGCGTGENAILFASAGHPTWGIDAARSAIDRAAQKAARRQVSVTFRVADALGLSKLGRTFDTVVDCNLFGYLSDQGRRTYVRGLAEVTRPGGTVFLLCYSEREPDWGGPRRIAAEEIRSVFADGWTVRSIEPARLESADPLVSGIAWLATVDRAGEAPKVTGAATLSAGRGSRSPSPRRSGGSGAARPRAPRRRTPTVRRAGRAR